jgi:SAM-dependent methyltransferase
MNEACDNRNPELPISKHVARICKRLYRRFAHEFRKMKQVVRLYWTHAKCLLTNRPLLVDPGFPLKFPRLNSKTPIRVLFVFHYPSVWPSWESVVDEMRASHRWKVSVVVAPFLRDHGTDRVLMLQQSKEILVARGINFIEADSFSLRQFRPHVVFVQTPHDQFLPDNLSLPRLIASGAKLCYVPYGLELGGSELNLQIQHNRPLHNNAWRIFARSQRHREMFVNHSDSKGRNVVVTGHPKLDRLCNQTDVTIPVEMEKKLEGRTAFLWAPHYDIAQTPRWSSYLTHSESIFRLFANRQDIALIFRPHPLFFAELRHISEIGREAEVELRKRLESFSNIFLDESPDYRPAFNRSCALMADPGSFLLEYLPTKKPILFLKNPVGHPLNSDRDVLELCYSASSYSDVKQFVDMTCEGRDPMREIRIGRVGEFLFGVGESAAGRIVNHIEASLCGGLQQRSENFWRSSPTTFLVSDDYYERLEEAIRAVLAKWIQKPLHSVLDIGCGNGRFTYQMASFCEKITGVDLSERFIQEARRKYECSVNSKLTFEVCQIGASRLPQGPYSLISCMGVTSCLPDENLFGHLLDEMSNCRLTDSGFLLLKDTLSDTSDDFINETADYVAIYRSRSRYINEVQCRGFDLLEEEVLVPVNQNGLFNSLFLFKRKNKLSEKLFGNE